MPDEALDNLEPDEQSEVETPEAEATEETTPEPEAPKEPTHVPMDRFKEVWGERQSAKQEAEALRYNNLLLQQTLIAQQQQSAKPVPVPPRQMTREEQELDEILEPFIARKMQPLVEDYRRKSEIIEQMAASQEAQRGMEYVQTNVPDFQQLAPDLENWLATQPKGYQDYITSHPNNVVLACNMIRAMRGAGGQAVAREVRNDLKGRARSESGASASRPDKSTTKDWANMTDEEFAAADASIRRNRTQF